MTRPPARPLHVATLVVPLAGVEHDDCRVEVMRGVARGDQRCDVVATRHRFSPQLDETVDLPACEGSDEDAALQALLELARRGLEGELLVEGVLSAAAVGVVLQWEASRRERAYLLVAQASLRLDAATPSALLAAARELGLDPQPDGVAVGQWRGRCPGRSHRLMLSANVEQFGCGYCHVRGGPEELHRLVAARRAGRAR